MAFLRKAGIWIISVLLSIAIFALVFGTFTTIDLKDAFGEIYANADKPVQQDFLDGVGGYCGQLDEMKQQFAEAEKQIEALKTEAEKQGMTLEELLMATGQYDDYRDAQQSMGQEDLKKFITVCDDYKNPDISKKKFFISFIKTMAGEALPDTDELLAGENSPLAGEGSPLGGSGIGEVLSRIRSLWKSLNISLPVFILTLLGLLFLFFIHEPLMYVKHVSKMLLRTGIWLVIPFLILQILMAVHPIDTTPIMNEMLKGLPSDGEVSAADISAGPQLDMKDAFLIMLPVILKQVYPFAIFLVGVLFILLGVAGLLVFKL